MLPINVATGRPYRGVNTVVLWASAQAKTYASAAWGTYRQWQKRGAQIRKGEQASPVVFWKITERGEIEGGSEEQEDSRGGRRFFARGYSVFNAAQVGEFEVPSPTLFPEAQRIERAETFFAGLGAAIQHGPYGMSDRRDRAGLGRAEWRGGS